MKKKDAPKVASTDDERRRVVSQIRMAHRWRCDFHNAEKGMILRIRAATRRLTATAGDTRTQALARAAVLYDELDDPQTDLGRETAKSLAAMLDARDALAGVRKLHQRAMVGLAQELPACEWFTSVPGCGALGLAQIVGEAGDLADYATVARLWKRMGVGLVDGQRQRRVAGTTKELKALGIAMGYCPRRRSVLFCLGDSMIKKQGEYRELYLARKQYEVATAEAAGLIVVPAAAIPKGHTGEYRSEGHVHNRARRYMEKRMLRDLWRAWRDV